MSVSGIECGRFVKCHAGAAQTMSQLPKSHPIAGQLMCRSCAAPLITTMVDLGVQPVSNAFRTRMQRTEAEMFYPLHAYVCDACWLVQLQDFGSPDLHFHGDYLYFSSFSSSWLAHAQAYASRMIARFGLKPGTQMVEIASNDGYLLQYFKKAGITCLGVDPAQNCADAALANHQIRTEVAFFGRETAERLVASGQAADMMAANNVLAHVPDINDFVAGFSILLKPEGVATFEFPHLMELIRNTQFDTIYHEHYSYLSLLALQPLFQRHGLQVFDVERLTTHGGSLRLFVSHMASRHAITPAVADLLAQETSAGLADKATYERFAEQVKAFKRSLVRMLIELKDQGLSIAAYGAPAKGNTLLNYAGMRSDIIDFTVDRNPAKQNLDLPGLGIPVLSPDAIAEHKPDIVVILPWNLSDEIMGELGHIKSWGGRFLVPIPTPRLVSPP